MQFKAVIAVATLCIAFAQIAHADTAAQTAGNCDIIGTVMSREDVQRSPWSDGAPSPFSISETDVSVKIENRLAHDGRSACMLKTGAATAVYKLCSPVDVKAGDHIHATEGNTAGTAGKPGCLFDITVAAP